MALTTYVVYWTATGEAPGEIVCAYHGDDGATPTFAVDQHFLDVGVADPLPTADTHKVDLNGPTLVAKTTQEQTDAADTQRKAEIERILGDLDATKEKMAARNFSTTAIDAEIAALEQEHAALP